MGKYLRYTGAPGTAFDDNGDAYWGGPGATAEVSAERAKELQAAFPDVFEETTKEDAEKEDTSKIVSIPVTKPEGEVRYRDPETGEESLTPFTRDATQEVKE